MVETLQEFNINIALKSKSFIIGAPMPMTVTFVNTTDHPVRMKQPDKVWEVRLEVTSLGGLVEDEGFGRIFMERPEEGSQRYVEEDAEIITLKPEEDYSFACDVARRFPQMLTPGIHVLRVIDVNKEEYTAASNPLDVTITLTQESVPRLMATIGDTTFEQEYREWAAEWLQRLKQDFRPQFAATDDPDSIREGCETATRLELNKFRTWWATTENSETALRRIQEINKPYFELIDDDEGVDMDLDDDMDGESNEDE